MLSPIVYPIFWTIFRDDLFSCKVCRRFGPLGFCPETPFPTLFAHLRHWDEHSNDGRVAVKERNVDTLLCDECANEAIRSETGSYHDDLSRRFHECNLCRDKDSFPNKQYAN